VVAKKTKTRLRKAVRAAEKLRREAARRHPTGPGSGPGFPDLPPPPPGDTGWGYDDGGAGVREPRHPLPTHPADAIALDPPRPQYLDLVG
jgi:hypothetical protein